MGDVAFQHRLADAHAQVFELLPVLRLVDGIKGSAQNLHAALIQHALLSQLHGQVQAGLAAQGGDNGIGPLHTDDPGHIFQIQGFHIHLVGDVGIGHDGGRVGVDQNDLVALFLQGQASLGARVIEFRRLSDDDGAGTDHQDLIDIGAFRHCCFLPLWRCPSW